MKSVVRIAAATLTAAAVTFAPWAAQQRPAVKPVVKPAHTCIAEIVVFEDGSWRGGRLIYDGKTVVTTPWERVMPQVGWLPGWNGTACKLTLI